MLKRRREKQKRKREEGKKKKKEKTTKKQHFLTVLLFFWKKSSKSKEQTRFLKNTNTFQRISIFSNLSTNQSSRAEPFQTLWFLYTRPNISDPKKKNLFFSFSFFFSFLKIYFLFFSFSLFFGGNNRDWERGKGFVGKACERLGFFIYLFIIFLKSFFFFHFLKK